MALVFPALCSINFPFHFFLFTPTHILLLKYYAQVHSQKTSQIQKKKENTCPFYCSRIIVVMSHNLWRRWNFWKKANFWNRLLFEIGLFQELTYFKNWPISKMSLFQKFHRRHKLWLIIIGNVFFRIKRHNFWKRTIVNPRKF